MKDENLMFEQILQYVSPEQSDEIVEPLLTQLILLSEKRARADEIAMFFQKFGQTESIGSTPSDFIQPEYWLNGDPEDYVAYFDERLTELNK